MDIIHEIAALPERDMCETLLDIDDATLERFQKCYGILDLPEDDREIASGDLLPFSAHVVIGERLHPDPPACRPLAKLLEQSEKASIMSAREMLGVALHSPDDVRVDSDAAENVAILTRWCIGAEPWRLRVVAYPRAA